MPVQASELISILQKHVAKNGDGSVLLYDDYAGTYKSFGKEKLSVTAGGRFAIECSEEDLED